MTVYIEKVDDSNRINWRVKVGKGRGARVVSRHKLKRRAKQRGRKVARDRGDVLKEQMHYGQWRTVTAY